MKMLDGETKCYMEEFEIALKHNKLNMNENEKFGLNFRLSELASGEVLIFAKNVPLIKTRFYITDRCSSKSFDDAIIKFDKEIKAFLKKLEEFSKKIYEVKF